MVSEGWGEGDNVNGEYSEVRVSALLQEVARCPLGPRAEG